MNYTTFIDGEYTPLSLKEILTHDNVWSARIGTGLFGFVDCSSGKRGPKAEVFFGIGDEGIAKIIDLGFIPCPNCKPESKLPDSINGIIHNKYNISKEDFSNKAILGFDIRRVNLEEILPLTGIPGRLYLPKGLNSEEVLVFVNRLRTLNKPLPELGYYDHTSPSRFTKYMIE